MSNDIHLECSDCDSELSSFNITHNLVPMAREAFLYLPMWHPDWIGITHARQLIEPLEVGIEVLGSDRDHFETFAPTNGWGSYDGLLKTATLLLAAAKEHPSAIVRTCT